MGTLDIASPTPQPNHVHVIIRHKMTENVHGLACRLFCHYGETDDAYLIGGLGKPNETLIIIVIRHCMHLVDFCLKSNHRLYLAKAIHGLVDHEPVKISIYAMDVFYKDLRWRAMHHDP